MNTTHALSIIIAIAIAGLSGSSYADDDRYTRHRAPSHEQVRTAFYELEQHGTWHQLERYGIGWCPTVATRTRNWNPYHSDGSWIFVDGNRQWSSHHGWGYMVFNTGEGSWRSIYGVWHWIPERGWRGFKQAIIRVPLRPIQYNPYRSDLHQDYPYSVHSQGNSIYYWNSTHHKKGIYYRNSSHNKQSIYYRNSSYDKKGRTKHISPVHQPRYKTPIAPQQPFGKRSPSKAKPHRSVHQTRYKTPIAPRQPFGKRSTNKAKPHRSVHQTPPAKVHDQNNSSREQKHGGTRKPW